MIISTLFSITLSTLLGASSAIAAPQAAAPPAAQKAPKYKAPKEMDLDSTTVEGRLRRPELSVVTGDNESSRDGLLRLRENFNDRITAEAGEELP